MKVTTDRSRETQQGRHISRVTTSNCSKDAAAQFLSKHNLWAEISSAASRPTRGEIWVKLSEISLYESRISAFWNIKYCYLTMFIWKKSYLTLSICCSHLLLWSILLNCCVLSLLYQRYVSIASKMPSEYWRRLLEKPHAAWPLIGLYIKPLGELPATSSLRDIFPSGLHMLWNNLLVTAAHNSCKQLPLLKMWLNSPHYYYANIHSAFEFFFL